VWGKQTHNKNINDLLSHQSEVWGQQTHNKNHNKKNSNGLLGHQSEVWGQQTDNKKSIGLLMCFDDILTLWSYYIF